MLDFLYLFLAIAAIAATPLLVSSWVHIRAGGLIALSTACTAAVAILINLVSFLFGSLPFTSIPLGLSYSGIPGAVTGLLLSIAKLLPFPSHSPNTKRIIRVMLSLLALAPLLLTAHAAIQPLLAPKPPW